MGKQIWVIDWEFIIDCGVKKIEEHYDVCGLGLPSPEYTGNMHILIKHKFSINEWLKPNNININELK